jgi:hypothetical protein
MLTWAEKSVRIIRMLRDALVVTKSNREPAWRGLTRMNTVRFVGILLKLPDP